MITKRKRQDHEWGLEEGMTTARKEEQGEVLRDK